MKYELKYEGCEVGDRIYEEYEFVVVEHPGPCRTCGQRARFLRVDARELLCSDDCSNAYQALERRVLPKHMNKSKFKFATSMIALDHPERCYVLFKERDAKGKRVRKYGWAVATRNSFNYFIVFFDDGTQSLVPLKRTQFISTNPKINFNKYRER